MHKLRRPFACAALAGGLLGVLPGALGAQDAVRAPGPLSELQAAIITDSSDPVAHYRFAVGLMSQARWRGAEAELQRALQLEPHLASAELALAYLPVLEGDSAWGARHPEAGTLSPQARSAALDLAERDAFLGSPLVDLRVLAAGYRRAGRVRDSVMHADLRELFQQGLTDLQAGNYEEAYKDFDHLAARRGWGRGQAPPLWIYWFRGTAAAHIRRWRVATEDLKSIVSGQVSTADSSVVVPLRPNDYRFILGAFHEFAAEFDDAERDLRSALEADDSLYMAHGRLAEIFESKSQWELAATEREHAVTAHPGDPTLLLEWGVALGRAGKYADAETRLLEAVEARPDNALTYYWLGIAQQQLGKGPEAKRSFQRFIAIAPRRYEFLIWQARQHMSEIP